MYDGDGKRIQKMEWLESMQTFQITTYMYRGFNILYEKNTDTGMDALLVSGPTGRIAKKAGGAVHYYHTDHLGSTRLVTDDNGTVVSQVVYQSFGLSANRGDPEKYSFAGKEKDASGLFYFGARYYDSEVGRFINRDPRLGELQNPQSLNRYVYCLNNPHRYKDTWGLSESSVNESCDCLDDVEIELSQLEKLEENMEIAQTELDMALEAIESGRYEELLEDCLDFLNDMAWQIPAIFDDKRDVDLVDLAMNAFWEYIQWVSEPFMFAYGLARAFYCTSRLWQYKMYLKTKRKNEKMLSDMGVKREALKQRISHRCPCAFQSQSLPSGALPENIEIT
jgi:RHS repeat-associated protein